MLSPAHHSTQKKHILFLLFASLLITGGIKQSALKLPTSNEANYSLVCGVNAFISMLLSGDPQAGRLRWFVMSRCSTGVQDVKFSITLLKTPAQNVGSGQPQSYRLNRKGLILLRVARQSCLLLTLTLAPFSLWSFIFWAYQSWTDRGPHSSRQAAHLIQWHRHRRKWPWSFWEAKPRHTLGGAEASCDRLPKTVGHTVNTRAWVNMKSNRVNKKQSNIKGFLSPSIAQGLWAELCGRVRFPLSVTFPQHTETLGSTNSLKTGNKGEHVGWCWTATGKTRIACRSASEWASALPCIVLISNIQSTLHKPSEKMSSVPKVRKISWLKGLGHAQFI